MIHHTSQPMKRQALPEDATTTDQEKRHIRRSKRVKRIIDSESDVLRDRESRDQVYNIAFDERFPSCASCFGACVNCGKRSPGRGCERCVEYGLPCIKPDRPYMRGSTMGIPDGEAACSGSIFGWQVFANRPAVPRAMAKAYLATSAVAIIRLLLRNT